MRLSREFNFDAAHALDDYPQGHPNTRIHGHSFRVRITVEGQPSDNGRIVDLEAVGALLEQARDQLDHRMLNDVEGLGAPTLENICLWLWGFLETDLPQICAVEVSRDSLGQSCLYQGSQHGR